MGVPWMCLGCLWRGAVAPGDSARCPNVPGLYCPTPRFGTQRVTCDDFVDDQGVYSGNLDESAFDSLCLAEYYFHALVLDR